MRTTIQATARSVISLIVIPVVLIAGILNAKISAAATYYVATTGDDARSCTTSRTTTTPKRTLNNAVTCLSAGDTLYVRAGTYTEALQDNIASGTSWQNPVTIAAYPGDATPILRPSSGMWVLHFQTFPGARPQQYIVIDGFLLDAVNVTEDVVKITGTGIAGQSANHIRIKNSELINAPGHGIIVTQVGADFNEFINVTIHDNGSPFGEAGWGHGVYLTTENNLFDNCQVYNQQRGYGFQVYSAGVSRPNNNIIRNCTVRDSGGAAQQAGILIASGNGNQVYNNVLYGNYIGIWVKYGAAASLIYNNTAYGNTDAGIAIGPQAANNIFKNNISFGNGNNTIPVVIDPAAVSGTVSSNDLKTDPKFVPTPPSSLQVTP